MKRIALLLSVCLSLCGIPMPCRAASLTISAQCALLCRGDGEVLFEKNADTRHSIASTTKILTAVLALENLPLTQEITIPKEATGIEGSSVYLRPGEIFSVEELLYALMLRSANDAAHALALAVSGSIEAFADLMNAKAQELGMSSSHFANPHGLPAKEHYSTARDMARLTVYAMRNCDFCRIVQSRKATLDRADGPLTVVNHNKLLFSYDGACGVKTGYTKESGRCLVSAAERDGVEMICVTLDASDDWRDHKSLLDYGFSLFVRESVLKAGEYRLGIDVACGKADTVVLTNADPLDGIFDRQHGALTLQAVCPPLYFAPIRAGDTAGYLVLYEDGVECKRIPLHFDSTVEACEPPRSLFERLKLKLQKKR